MRTLMYLSILSVLLAACSNSNSGEQEPFDDYLPTNTLSFWVDSATYTAHHDLVETANNIWQFNRGEDIDDTYEYRKSWYLACRDSLLAYYNAKHEDMSLSDFEKADSVLLEIHELFEHYRSGSTMDMIIGYDIDYDIHIYRQMSYSMAVIEESKKLGIEDLCREEMLAFKSFEDSLSNFGSELMQIEFFGGSGAGLSSLYMSMEIQYCRERMLTEVLRLFTSGKNDSKNSSFDSKFEVSYHHQDNQERSTTDLIALLPSSMSSADWRGDYDFQQSDYYEDYLDLFNHAAVLIVDVNKTMQEWLIKNDAFAASLPKQLRPKYKALVRQYINQLYTCLDIASKY